MTKDVFISYSTHDKAIADKLSMILEELGLDCWIAPRDIPPGAEFDVAILDGIDQCQAMVLILTPEANVSVFVKNEVNRAFSRGKAILTFRPEDIKPAKALEFYLARHQWTDGFPPPVEERIARMAGALLELVGRPLQTTPTRLPTTTDPIVAEVEYRLRYIKHWIRKNNLPVHNAVNGAMSTPVLDPTNKNCSLISLISRGWGRDAIADIEECVYALDMSEEEFNDQLKVQNAVDCLKSLASKLRIAGFDR